MDFSSTVAYPRHVTNCSRAWDVVLYHTHEAPWWWGGEGNRFWEGRSLRFRQGCFGSHPDGVVHGTPLNGSDSKHVFYYAPLPLLCRERGPRQSTRTPGTRTTFPPFHHAKQRLVTSPTTHIAGGVTPHALELNRMHSLQVPYMLRTLSTHQVTWTRQTHLGPAGGKPSSKTWQQNPPKKGTAVQKRASSSNDGYVRHNAQNRA